MTSHGASRTAGSRLPCSALPGSTRRTASSSGTRQSTPTTSAPASPSSPEQLAGADAEVDPRHAGGGQRVEDPPAVRQHGPPVVLRAERARPGVEQLHGADARPRPGRRRNAIVMSVSLAQQRVPQRRVPVHQRLGAVEALRRAAVDQVAGQGERAAGEPDQRRAAELGDQRPDRLGHERRHRPARSGRSRARSASPRIGCSTTGPTPGAMSMPTPTALQRHARCR